MATVNKNLSDYDKTSLPDASPLRIGVVVSEWNTEITESLFEGAQATLKEAGLLEENLLRWNVPGSFELVFGCKRMLEKHAPDAIIAIGSVIRGETAHFDYVCSAVAQGIKDLNVRYNIPVIFCVLTDDNLQQAQDRSGGKHGNKGTEAAVVVLKMAVLGN